MSRHTAFSFFLIASILLIFSFAFPQQSFAAEHTGRFAQCKKPEDTSQWGWLDGICANVGTSRVYVQCPIFKRDGKGYTDYKLTGEKCAK